MIIIDLYIAQLSLPRAHDVPTSGLDYCADLSHKRPNRLLALTRIQLLMLGRNLNVRPLLARGTAILSQTSLDRLQPKLSITESTSCASVAQDPSHTVREQWS